MKKNRLVNGFIIGTFVMLYILVSLISTIHVIDFFELSNPRGMSIALAIAFEVGAAASLASLITLDKMNKTLVWALFIAITAMQMQGNMFYAFQNLEGYASWVELFNLVDEEPLFQKRVLAFVSGAILPLVALGFIKSLVDYIKPEDEVKVIEEDVEEPGKQNDPEEDPFDWARFEDDSEEELMKDFEFDTEEWEDLSQEEWNDIVEDPEEITKEEQEELLSEIMQRDQELGLYDEELPAEDVNPKVIEPVLQEEPVEEGYWNKGWANDLTDEELDEVVEAFQNAEEFIVEEEVKEPESLEKAVEAIKPKQPVKDVDEAYRFGNNLYKTMMKKMNSDHLPKPSAEQVSKAYKNLGLVDRDKK